MNARTLRMGTLLVLFVSLFAMAGWGQGVAPKGIIPTPPESTSLQVSIWVDRGAYAVGESITIHYSVNKPAYIYIWDVEPDGQSSPFFPNSLPGGVGQLRRRRRAHRAREVGRSRLRSGRSTCRSWQRRRLSTPLRCPPAMRKRC